MLLGSIVEMGGQNVTLTVAIVGIGAPAGGVKPFLTVASSIDVDADHEGVGNGMADTTRDPVCSPAALLQGDVLFFGDQ